MLNEIKIDKIKELLSLNKYLRMNGSLVLSMPSVAMFNYVFMDLHRSKVFHLKVGPQRELSKYNHINFHNSGKFLKLDIMRC